MRLPLRRAIGVLVELVQRDLGQVDVLGRHVDRCEVRGRFGVRLEYMHSNNRGRWIANESTNQRINETTNQRCLRTSRWSILRMGTQERAPHTMGLGI